MASRQCGLWAEIERQSVDTFSRRKRTRNLVDSFLLQRERDNVGRERMPVRDYQFIGPTFLSDTTFEDRIQSLRETIETRLNFHYEQNIVILLRCVKINYLHTINQTTSSKQRWHLQCISLQNINTKVLIIPGTVIEHAHVVHLSKQHINGSLAWRDR
jgi:hypothetical protein